MKLIMSDKHIVAFATTGDLAGSIEFSGTIPADFINKFEPFKYDLVSDEIVKNAAYEDNNNYVPTVNDDPSISQLMINQLVSMVATQQVTINAIQAQLEKEK